MAPAQWTEAHHIIPWQDGGDTSVDNGVLCCSRHHHYLHDRGWTVRLVGNIAWFTPPYNEDINRRERRNTYHRGS
ncbi:HNH endonuclease [Arthrobacter psychrolactophilus]